MRPTMTPAAAARSAPLTPRRANKSGRPSLVERPQTQLLDADAAGADQAQRVDVDQPAGCRSVRRSGNPARLGAAGEQLRGDALRFLLDGGRASAISAWPMSTSAMRVHSSGQCPGNVEVAPRLSSVRSTCDEAFGWTRRVRNRACPGPAGWVRRMNCCPIARCVPRDLTIMALVAFCQIPII